MQLFYRKKSLGQNFLRDERVLAKIADAAKIAAGETVLEIGPGEGNLTAELLSQGAKVIAVEKDDRLIPILQNKFASAISSGRLILLHEDILESDFPYTLKAFSYKLVANIPYYITGELLRLVLSRWPNPQETVLLLQKEVAERITAKDGKESILSISVKAYSTPKIMGIVKAGAFSPAPEVDSAILWIGNISKNNFGSIDENRFFTVVKTGFAHKRKIIAGNLKPLFSENTEKILGQCGIQATSRPETIDLKKWLCLAMH